MSGAGTTYRQGVPLSPYATRLYLKIDLLCARENHTMTGGTLGGEGGLFTLALRTAILHHLLVV